MGKPIRMGNDEFILYVRKQNKESKYDTKKLGELICKWLKEHAELKEKDIKYDVECLWGEQADTTFLPINSLKQQVNSFLTETIFLLYMTISTPYNHSKNMNTSL